MAFSIKPGELDELDDFPDTNNQPAVADEPPEAPNAVPFERTLPAAMRDATRWILHDKNKVPLNPRTQRKFDPKNGKYTNIPELWTTYENVERHKQVGFVLGDGFTSIDLDDVIVDGKILPWAQELITHFNTYAEYSIRGKGIHLWFKGNITGHPLVKALDHIEVYWNGRYIAVTGNHVPGTPTELREDDSEILQEFYDRLTSGDMVDHFGMVGLIRDGEQGGKIPVTCPWAEDHSDHTGTLESALFVDGTGMVTGYKCLHSHCSDRKLPAVVKWTGLKYPRVASGPRVSLAGWIMARPGVIAIDKPANYERALTNLKVQFRWNAFKGQAEISTDGSKFVFYDDPQDGHLFYGVSQQLQSQPRRDVFETVKHELWQRQQYHPVREYLSALVWDGVPRINRWLIDLAGSDDTPFIQAVSGIILIAGVRRIRQPGVKFDEMLVLESPQGMNKSTALRCMAVNDSWFLDDLPLGAESKQVIEATIGKWIVEAAELSGLNNRREAADIKSFMSRQIDEARLAYAHEPISHAREFIVVGSTNNHEYLQDPTGNRRFWPVAIKAFDIPALSKVRDQLWAEAAFREAQGEAIRLPQELWGAAGVEQAKREREDPWMEDLTAITEGADFIQSLAIWHTLRESSKDSGKSLRLNNLMRKLGFVKKRVLYSGTKIYAWLRLGSNVERGLVAYPNQRLLRAMDFNYEIGELDQADQPAPPDK